MWLFRKSPKNYNKYSWQINAQGCVCSRFLWNIIDLVLIKNRERSLDIL